MASRVASAPVWIALSLLAGLLQVVRNAASKALGRDVPHLLNTWARFTFNLPFTATVLLLASAWAGWPVLTARFWLWTAACALTQSLANTCLVAAFARIPFARAVVLHKLEVALAPFVGVLLFGEYPSLLGWSGVFLCAVGTVAINLAARPGAGWRELLRFDRGSVYAFGSAANVVFASFFLKAGCSEFVAGNVQLPHAVFLAAMHSLVHAAWMQSVVLTLVLACDRRRPLRLVRPHLPGMLRLGAAAAVSSVCWFWAYALQYVAYVKALGQVEVVAAALWGHFLLREAGVRRLVPAMVLVLAGILLVLLG